MIFFKSGLLCSHFFYMDLRRFSLSIRQINKYSLIQIPVLILVYDAILILFYKMSRDM